MRRQPSLFNPEPSEENNPGKVRRRHRSAAEGNLARRGAAPGPSLAGPSVPGRGGTRGSSSRALRDGEANPGGSGCGGVGRATYPPLRPFPSRECPARGRGAPSAPAAAPTRVPAAGRSQPHGGRRGRHRAHTALPQAPQQIIPLSQAFIKLSHGRRREGKKKKVKHTRCCWARLSTPRAPSCCTLPSQV